VATRRESRIGRCVTLLLLCYVALFAPLNYADLPDQTSLGGLWDGGDNDDIILQLEATGGIVEPFVLRSIDPILRVVLYLTPLPVPTAVLSAVVATDRGRAPPTL
jgi:hypothetical protein